MSENLKIPLSLFNEQFINAIDVSTRAKRRKTVELAVNLLEHIRFAEEANIDNFPLNLQNSEAYDNAECSLEVIMEAIIYLLDAY